jgi:cellulose synthase/poly-beta-1,6-N-acetylglucosamine synthase-like glycosyltransferase
MDIKKLNDSWIQEPFKDLSQQYGLQKVYYPPYLPHAGGSGLGVKRSIHEAVGGFDESLPRLMDTDYCFRIQLTGAKLHFVPEAIIHIRLREELGGMFRQARVWGQYNVLMYKRYGLPAMKMAQPWKQYMKRWKGLLWRFPQIYSKGGQAAWLTSLGWQIGRLQGSIKYRVPPV